MASHDPLNTVDGALVVGQLTEQEQAERRAAAVRHLTKRGAADLIDVLGLGDDPKPVKRTAPSKLYTIDVTCPHCEAGPKQPCTTRANKQTPHHLQRRQAAEAERERRAAA